MNEVGEVAAVARRVMRLAISFSPPLSSAQRHSCNAGDPKKRDRGRLGHSEFGYQYLAIAAPDAANQDLVRTGVEGAAALAGFRAVLASASTNGASSGAPAIAATPAAGGIASASETACSRSRQGRETATATRPDSGAEKSAAASAALAPREKVERRYSAICSSEAIAVRAGEAGATVQEKRNIDAQRCAATAAGDHQRRVSGPHDKTAAAAPTSSSSEVGSKPGAAHRDLQDLPRRQAEVPANLGTYAARPGERRSQNASALRTEGEDAVDVSAWHRKGDQSPRVGEVDQGGLCSPVWRGQRHTSRCSKQNPFHPTARRHDNGDPKLSRTEDSGHRDRGPTFQTLPAYLDAAASAYDVWFEMLAMRAWSNTVDSGRRRTTYAQGDIMEAEGALGRRSPTNALNELAPKAARSGKHTRGRAAGGAAISQAAWPAGLLPEPGS